MQRLNKSITHAVDRPVKVMQFGEGNFLRAFVDYIFDVTNEKTDFNGGVVIVKPIEFGTLERFHDQECQYTLQLRGFVDGQPKEITRQITSVVDAVAAIEDYDKFMEYGTSETLRFIVSNTTEAGIVFDETDDFNACPPKTYPGKLTKLLFERYKKFNGAADKGLILLPCELIADNGIELKKCIMQFIDLWKLEDGFKDWVNTACSYAVQIANFSYCVGAALAQANAIMTGWRIGAKEFEECNRGTRKAAIYGIITATCFSVTFAFAGHFIVHIFTDDTQMINLVVKLLIVDIFLEFGRVTNLVYGQALKTSGDALFPVILGAIFMYLFAVGGTYFLGIHMGLLAVGAYIAMAGDECARAVGMVLRWKSGKWKSKGLVEV